MNKEEIIKTAERIDGWMARSELGVLYDLVHGLIKKGDHAVEVGSWKGRSAFVFASVCKEKGAKLTCIDTFTGSQISLSGYKEALDMGATAFFNSNIKKNLAGLPVDYIIENSLTAHRHIKNSSLVFCFIDGDHTEPVVNQDIENYWPKVKEGGVYAGHDYNMGWPAVVMAVDDKCPDPNKFELFGSTWVIRK